MPIFKTVVTQVGLAHTVPLKSKLPPSRETRVLSLETRCSSRETVRKTVSVCINEDFPKINLFTKTLVLPNVTLDTEVLGQNAVDGGVIFSLRVDISREICIHCTLIRS